jgi:hypothetical protein
MSQITKIEVEVTTNNPGWYVPEGAANAVLNKAGEYFYPAGTVTQGRDGISVMLERETVQQVLGDQNLFEAACDSVCRAAIGVVNLTQHEATTDQRDAGVVSPPYNAHVKVLLTFDAIPSASDIEERAVKLAEYAYSSGCKQAMIGGAPYLMSALERALKAQGITPVYAFSQRESVETTNEDGSLVVKTNMFKHVGFVKV